MTTYILTHLLCYLSAFALFFITPFLLVNLFYAWPLAHQTLTPFAALMQEVQWHKSYCSNQVSINSWYKNHPFKISQDFFMLGGYISSGHYLQITSKPVDTPSPTAQMSAWTFCLYYILGRFTSADDPWIIMNFHWTRELRRPSYAGSQGRQTEEYARNLLEAAVNSCEDKDTQQ